MATANVSEFLLRLTRGMGAATLSDWSDRQLVERLLAERDEAAFASIVRRHGPMVYRVCWRVLQQGQDAEDAFQATFLLLAQQLRTLRKHASLASWLHGVAHRVALKAKAQAATRRRHEQRAPVSQSLPSDQVRWAEVRAILDAELAGLPEKWRLPLVLCYLEGRTQDEAAGQLGWSKRTLRRRLEEGRTALGRRLTRRGLWPGALSAVLLSDCGASAALPAELVDSTIKAGHLFAGGPSAAGAVSRHILALAEGVVDVMAVTRMKMGVVLLVALGALAAGTALAAHQLLAGQQPPAQQAVVGKPVERRVDSAKLDAVQDVRTDRYGDPLPEGAAVRLGTVRFRHANGGTLAFAPDGKSILTSGGDRTIRTWDAATGQLLREQRLPPGLISAGAVLSPNGRLLAFQNEVLDTLSLWDVARNRLRHKLPLGERGWQRALFSPDGKTLVTAQRYGPATVRAWDVATGQGRVLGNHKREVSSLSFAADGTLMTQSGDQTIRLWDLAAGRERSRLSTEFVPGAKISPDGRVVAIWSCHNPERDKGVQFLDAATGQPATGWTAPNVKQVHSIRFAPDGKTVLVGMKDGILVWDPVAGKKVRTLPGGKGYNLTFSPDAKTLAALGVGDPTSPCGAVLHVWDLATGAPRTANAFEQGHLDEVDGVAFAPDGRTVASSCRGDHSVRLWDALTGRLLRSLPVKEELTFHSLTFTPDGKHLLVGTSPAILRWDVRTGKEVSRYSLDEAGRAERHHLMVMHLTDDGRTILGLSQVLNGKGDMHGLHAWDVATGKRLRHETMTSGDFGSGYSRFSPDGRLLAHSGSSIRDAATGKELPHPTVADKGLGLPVAFSADGALFATGIWQEIKHPYIRGSEMIALQVWELASLLPVARLETGALAHVAFTPDGSRLVTAGRDAITLWDLATRKVIARRPAPGRFCGSFGASFASSFALARDGRTVATGQADTTVMLWNLSPPAVVRPSAPLTAAEQEVCWTDLAGADAGRALAALSRLADAPTQAMALARDRLRPAQAPTTQELRRLIAELEDAPFARRQAATKRLSELGELAEAALRETLRRQPSLEVRRRIEGLFAEPRLVKTPEARRHLRAVRLLEHIGTPEAQEVLKSLTKGAPEARLTREAKASLDRLAKRSSYDPETSKKRKKGVRNL